ncbi:MAG TPA: molybdenum cofactor biosynthesis protein MoaE [Gemmatimonadaceae bacterium]|nr:molybdenum cofactor biosynthesis protein MoaE [Gemmatimonadaceae bacterium]
MIRTAIVSRPIDSNDLSAEVSSGEYGAIAWFLGVVRNNNDGREVEGIEYTAYNAMAESELRKIAIEATEQFTIGSLVVEHRVGFLSVGEISVAIVAGAARSRAALDTTRFVIEEIKKRVPIWKLEHYADGTREWVDATKARSAAAT